jgi:hypothetical protein
LKTGAGCVRSGVSRCHQPLSSGAAPVVNKFLLLKSCDQGNKKALIGKTNQGFIRRWKVKSI